MKTTKGLQRHTSLRRQALGRVPKMARPDGATEAVNVLAFPKRKKVLRKSRTKMTPLRRAAKGHECTIRIPCRCIDAPDNHESTVLAHYRLGTGGGQKPNDMQAARACFVCHEIVDGRMKAPEFTYEQIRLMHAEGVLRTQEAIRREAV